MHWAICCSIASQYSRLCEVCHYENASEIFLFFETRSSRPTISAMDWDIAEIWSANRYWPWMGDVTKAATGSWLATRCRHLEVSSEPTLQGDLRLQSQHALMPKQIHRPLSIIRSKSKPDVKFHYGTVCFPKPGSQPVSRGLRYLIQIWSGNALDLK